MLIGLHGKKQAGKDTAYERLVHLYGDRMSVERVSFADLLYESAAAALGLSVNDLSDWKTDPAVRIEVIRSDNGRRETKLAHLSVRRYLQNYGTEAHREVFGRDFWVEQVDLSHEGKLVVVTDVRFPNEASHVMRAGGFVVQVFGTDSVEGAADDHASEAALNPAFVNYHVQNHKRGDNFEFLDAGLTVIVDRLMHWAAS